MTREEQLNEAWCKYRCKCNTEIMQALAFALRWCDEHPRWISVDDELPKDSGGFYLSVDKNGEIWYRQYTKLYGWRSMVGNMFISGWEVTHWMPTPQPPKKGGEE